VPSAVRFSGSENAAYSLKRSDDIKERGGWAETYLGRDRRKWEEALLAHRLGVGGGEPRRGKKGKGDISAREKGKEKGQKNGSRIIVIIDCVGTASKVGKKNRKRRVFSGCEARNPRCSALRALKHLGDGVVRGNEEVSGKIQVDQAPARYLGEILSSPKRNKIKKREENRKEERTGWFLRRWTLEALRGKWM